MPIILRLDRMMADRKMSLNELSERVGVANVNLSKLKNGHVSAIRFSTLEAICDVLDCQPGDIMEFQRAEEPTEEKPEPFMESLNPTGTRHNHDSGLAEGSWKGMKKYLEKDMLCEKLRGRVSYHCDKYPKFSRSASCFTVSLDDATVKKFGYYHSGSELGWPQEFPWDMPMAEREEYTDWEFTDALEAYRRQPIGESLASENPIQRMFAIVDRRVGKRTLQKLAETVADQPEWLRAFYLARMDAESIAVPSETLP